MSDDLQCAVEKVEAMGRAGLVVSLCYGASAGRLRWSVTVMQSNDFSSCWERPFAARDFLHAIEIAEIESRRRGWLA